MFAADDATNNRALISGRSLRDLSLRVRLPADVHMIGSHEIRPEGSGTRNLLRVDAHGPAAVLLWPMLRLATSRALAAENRGLKSWCEGERRRRRRG